MELISLDITCYVLFAVFACKRYPLAHVTEDETTRVSRCCWETRTLELETTEILVGLLVPLVITVYQSPKSEGSETVRFVCDLFHWKIHCANDLEVIRSAHLSYVATLNTV